MTADFRHHRVTVDEKLTQEIRRVPNFRDSESAHLDIAATLDYFRRKFVEHIFLDPVSSHHTLSDIGTGYGWLAMALAAFTPARIVATDIHKPRLDAARCIGELLGLGDRIDWRLGSVQSIPLGDREADAVFCVEVLEHIQRDVAALRELERVTAQFLVITTPNGAFPVIAHDTRLPFCHWLPTSMRNTYARAFGRLQAQENNLFWNPAALSRHLPHFQRVSKFLHYRKVDDFFDLYPYYLPYGTGQWRYAPSAILRTYLRLISQAGGASQYFLYSLSGTFERRTEATN